ncbi:hypothetical protein PHYSODRAFT_331066 [Phytophthora sojae]|uniref:Uncharacterized protein n=1 Tax=Phytophthora sojae (strain P6497) TaxID=1094619 RepID=G4ZFE7_PHYSP|nr:hypothetical protein PHYSODRAFT_331066 [Phytophthora sojae]EGZ17036.1 hypothetical protein PHYSODRAFT_331066 [Phytophthora sojae]|eukprot:XP_009526094.1 hypothetical protein PHYSODRAFT_331066 [Phytophthora sojae]
MEALKLMAAVAHVDNSACAYLLMKHCGAFVGRDPDRAFEEHVSARFLLELFLEGRNNERTATYEDVLVRFLGVDQIRNPSDKYVKTLARIAALDSNSRPDKPGVDLKIPIRVYFRVYGRGSSGGVMEELADIRNAEKRIKREWEAFERDSEAIVVPSGAMRCRFVLEPMIASYEKYKISSELAQALDSMVARNVWFSQIMLSMTVKPELLANSRALKKI